MTAYPPKQLAQIIEAALAAPFASDLLEVDGPLWGGFWHFDVISPGYRLPAVELALLRAIRLDGHWPEGTTVAQFRADLRQAIAQPQAGIWTLNVAHEPCVVFAAQSIPPLITVVWYCITSGHLHAGYRTTHVSLPTVGVVIQREPGFTLQTNQPLVNESSWLAQITTQTVELEKQSFAARLDAEILGIRAGNKIPD